MEEASETNFTLKLLFFLRKECDWRIGDGLPTPFSTHSLLAQTIFQSHFTDSIISLDWTWSKFVLVSRRRRRSSSTLVSPLASSCQSVLFRVLLVLLQGTWCRSDPSQTSKRSLGTWACCLVWLALAFTVCLFAGWLCETLSCSKINGTPKWCTGCCWQILKGMSKSIENSKPTTTKKKDLKLLIFVSFSQKKPESVEKNLHSTLLLLVRWIDDFSFAWVRSNDILLSRIETSTILCMQACKPFGKWNFWRPFSSLFECAQFMVHKLMQTQSERISDELCAR